MTSRLRIDCVDDRELLRFNGRVVGEFAGDCFIRSCDSVHSYMGKDSLSLNEDILLFNQSHNRLSLIFYFKDEIAYCSVEEFMAFGDWVNYTNGEWVIHCPIKYMRVYPNPKHQMKK